MPSSGIAQGGIVSTPDGNWYALLFQDNGAVGRIPVLIPVQWTEDHWPVLGNQGVAVDEILPMPGNPQKQKTNIVTSDEFNNDAKRLIISDKELGTGVTAGLSVKQMICLKRQTEIGRNTLKASKRMNTATMVPI